MKSNNSASTDITDVQNVLKVQRLEKEMSQLVVLVVRVCMAMHALNFVALLLILIQGFQLGIFIGGLIGLLEMPLLHACILWLELPFSPDLHQPMVKPSAFEKAFVESSAGSLQSSGHHDPACCPTTTWGLAPAEAFQAGPARPPALSQGLLIGRAQVLTASPWSPRWSQAGRLQGCQWTSCARLPHASFRSQPCGSCL